MVSEEASDASPTSLPRNLTTNSLLSLTEGEGGRDKRKKRRRQIDHHNRKSKRKRLKQQLEQQEEPTLPEQVLSEAELMVSWATLPSRRIREARPKSEANVEHVNNKEKVSKIVLLVEPSKEPGMSVSNITMVKGQNASSQQVSLRLHWESSLLNFAVKDPEAFKLFVDTHSYPCTAISIKQKDEKAQLAKSLGNFDLFD